MEQQLQNKKGLVEKVFDKVFDRYDLMNDFMSLGVHRFWKKDLINMMAPTKNKKLIDVACGTGDIAKLFLNNTNKGLNNFSEDIEKNSQSLKHEQKNVSGGSKKQDICSMIKIRTKKYIKVYHKRLDNTINFNYKINKKNKKYLVMN